MSAEDLAFSPVDKRNKTAWDYITERCRRRFEAMGIPRKVLEDPKMQKAWSRAVFAAGGVPYMWDLAVDFKRLMYDSLVLRRGDKVLLIGEWIEECGFTAEVKKRIGNEGELVAHEILEIFEKGVSQWRWDYADKYPDEHFDAVFCPQNIHHHSDWKVGAKDLTRVLKKDGRVVIAEMTLGGPGFRAAIHSDIHIYAIMKKIFYGMGASDIFEGKLYYGFDTIMEAFTPYLKDIHTFEWKGALLFYGTRK